MYVGSGNTVLSKKDSGGMITVRLSKELHVEFIKACRANCKPMNTTIVGFISEYVKQFNEENEDND